MTFPQSWPLIWNGTNQNNRTITTELMEVTHVGKRGHPSGGWLSEEQHNLIIRTRHQESEDLVSALPHFLTFSLISNDSLKHLFFQKAPILGRHSEALGPISTGTAWEILLIASENANSQHLWNWSFSSWVSENLKDIKAENTYLYSVRMYCGYTL